jgi:aryl-alcohol dehydrogenase-like predicted oxidoreductase
LVAHQIHSSKTDEQETSVGSSLPAMPAVSRLNKTADSGPPVPFEHVYQVVDAIDVIATETGKSVSQIVVNWLRQRPTVSSVIVGARNEQQLRPEPRSRRLEVDFRASGGA